MSASPIPDKTTKVYGHDTRLHKTLKELFKYSQICGNNTGAPPTTPGGMTVRPVTMGTILNIFDTLSKLWAAIFHGLPHNCRKRDCAHHVPELYDPETPRGITP